MHSYFAQDPTNLKAAEKFLVDAMASTSSDLYWMALVDAAFDHGREAASCETYRARGLNCFTSVSAQGVAQDVPLDDLGNVAPWLVELESHSRAGQRHLEALLAHCSGRPMLSMLASRVPVETLAARWQPLHLMHAPDKQRLLLRFADTRTLPTLAKVLDDAQWTALSEPVEHWCYVSRKGTLATIVRPTVTSGSSSPMPEGIHIAQAQLDALVAACEPDAALDFLADSTPEVFPQEFSPAGLHAYLEKSPFRIAALHGVEAWPDKMTLVTSALLTRGQILDDPKLEALLSAKAWAPGNLHKALMDSGLI